jgi:hypothetical protein
MGAATMLSALWAVNDVYWGWQFNLDRMRWAAWLGFTGWAAILGFGPAGVLQIARAGHGGGNLRKLMLFQVPLVLFNLFMVPEYIYYSFRGGIFPVPLAGLGLVLLGLQMQSWAYAALQVGRETAVRSHQAPTPARNMVGEGPTASLSGVRLSKTR